MPNQFRAISNRRIVPYSQAAGVRQGASRLREQYAMRDARERQKAEMDLGERQFTQQQSQFDARLGFEREAHQEGMQLQRSQFLSRQKREKEAAGMARGGFALQAGFGAAKLADSKMGLFKGAGGQVEKLGRGLGIGDKPQVMEDPSLGVDPSVVGRDAVTDSGPGFLDMPSGGQALRSGIGGFAGGAMGAGAAKALGAKKKWQTMAAGASAGIVGSFLSGGDSIWDLGIGGLMGGGIGALIW